MAAKCILADEVDMGDTIYIDVAGTELTAVVKHQA